MSVVNTAKEYLGKVSYTFGADNVEGGSADCSSFTQYVYKKNGYSIGRDTTAQLSNTQKVEKSDLQAGDLVFFQGTYRKGVSHVGIYIGNNEFIHCSSKAKNVIVSSLNDSYWKSHWLQGGRVTGTSSGVTGVINTSTSSTTWGLGGKVNSLIKNVAVTVIIALVIIIGIVLFIQAFDIDLF